MGAVRRYLGMLAVVIILGGLAVGLFALAGHFRDNRPVAGLALGVGRLLMVGGALLATMLFFTAVLGPKLATKLFFVRNKALTLDAVNDLRAKESEPATVSMAPGQGVLRVIPIKPGWWLDDAYAADATPVVAVENAELRLPGWHPHDVAVRVGAPEVLAWMPRHSGNPGRRIRNTVRVSQGRVSAVVFRPSSLPELGGTLEPLDSELNGKPSFFRIAVGAALLIGIAYGVWQLAAG